MRLYLLAFLTLLVLLPAQAQGSGTPFWGPSQPDHLKDVADVLGGELPCQLLRDDGTDLLPLLLLPTVALPAPVVVCECREPQPPERVVLQPAANPASPRDPPR